MKNTKLRLFIALSTATMIAGYSGAALAAHSGGDVSLKSATGGVVTAGSAVPYSPKQTCGTAICHNYESDPFTVTKQQTVGGIVGAPYDVTFPAHGVSAGYHFQQGMNVAWGDAQRSFYGLPSFTSAPGMFGKY